MVLTSDYRRSKFIVVPYALYLFAHLNELRPPTRINIELSWLGGVGGCEPGMDAFV